MKEKSPGNEIKCFGTGITVRKCSGTTDKVYKQERSMPINPVASHSKLVSLRPQVQATSVYGDDLSKYTDMPQGCQLQHQPVKMGLIRQQFDTSELGVYRTGDNPNRLTPPHSYVILLKSGPITLDLGYLR